MHIVFTKNSAGDDWVCTKKGKPQCNGMFTKQPRLSSTVYHQEHLALYCAARVAVPVKIDQIKLTLQPVIRQHKDVSESWWGRMRKLVEQAKLGGSPEQFLTRSSAFREPRGYVLRPLREISWSRRPTMMNSEFGE